MNERLEIEGDAWDEIREAEECNFDQPQHEEWTDEELENFFQEWKKRNGIQEPE